MNRSVLLFLLVVTCSACVLPRETTEAPRDRPLTWSSYEDDFKPENYRPQPPLRDRGNGTLDHDVPTSMMGGQDTSLSGGPTRTVSGFRIQVISTQSRATAETTRENLLAWWQSARQDLDAPRTLGQDLGIYVSYEQPYYKVRIGDFIQRADADQAVSFVREQFPDAWIVPDMVNAR